MSFFFEYIWFRISKLYRKEDKIGITGSGILAFSQFILVGNLIDLVLKQVFDQSILTQYAKQTAYAEVGLMFLLMYLNHRMYSHNYDHYLAEWNKEPRLKSFVKGLLVLIFLIAPLAWGFSMMKWV